MSDTENKKTATERLETLEDTVSRIIQALQPFDMMLKDLSGLKEALKLLNHKLDAVITCVNNSEPITDVMLSKLMTDNAAKELADKVEQMVKQGILVASDTVTKDSFVVINETDKDGKVVNPRMQFLVSALQHEEVRTKLEGAKVGANLPIGTDGVSVNVLEAYDVANPQATATADTAAGAAPTPAAETTATTTTETSAADSSTAAS